MKTALLASYFKDDNLLRLARLLYHNNWQLVCTVGTAKFLSKAGIPCRDLADIAGPPILGHHLITFARKIYAAILAKSDEDLRELERLNMRPISLLYVRFNEIERAIESGSATDEDVLEQTDIGGPTLLSAGVKGRRLVLTDPAQISELESWVEGGSHSDERERLIATFAAVAQRRAAIYMDTLARYWESRVRL